MVENDYIFYVNEPVFTPCITPLLSAAHGPGRQITSLRDSSELTANYVYSRKIFNIMYIVTFLFSVILKLFRRSNTC